MDIQTLSHQLITYGYEEKMQDLYIYFLPEEVFIQFRRNKTVLRYEQQLSHEQATQLIARFKYLGGMDVGEKRKAQMGAISYPLDQGTQRLRLSTVGNYRDEESLVIRFLHQMHTQTFAYFMPEVYQTIVERTKASGLYLFSGPTGSGKTTLMYTLARQSQGQVITIEDPVEIEEPFFLQLQTNDKIQQTYDQLIKLSLRHRPDVLIIGEIRDGDTAKAAVRAALTGHKVFATVHAKGVNETQSRLVDLIGETGELSQCLMGIVYQKLFESRDGETKAALAYTFFDEPEVTMSWSDVVKWLKEQRDVDEIE